MRAADRMLLFAGIAPQAALDSNGVRTFVRLGLAKEHSSYSTTYREAVNAVRAHGLAKADWLKQLYYVMRMHGKTLCKRTPLCSQCPLAARCPRIKITRALGGSSRWRRLSSQSPRPQRRLVPIKAPDGCDPMHKVFPILAAALVWACCLQTAALRLKATRLITARPCARWRLAQRRFSFKPWTAIFRHA